jgi:Ca2+/Na+ antiporter
MKISKTTLIYIYAVALCLMTFLLAKRVITSINTNEFDYFKLVANLILIVYFIIKIVKLGKEQNNQDPTSLK